MSHSDVAHLREQITREHQAACWALTGLASGTLQHRFITRRMQRIDAHYECLHTLIGEQASMQILNHVFEQRPSLSQAKG